MLRGAAGGALPEPFGPMECPRAAAGGVCAPQVSLEAAKVKAEKAKVAKDVALEVAEENKEELEAEEAELKAVVGGDTFAARAACPNGRRRRRQGERGRARAMAARKAVAAPGASGCLTPSTVRLRVRLAECEGLLQAVGSACLMPLIGARTWGRVALFCSQRRWLWRRGP